MKKVLKTMLLISVCFLLTACWGKEDEVENPMKKYDSLEEINEIAKSKIVPPALAGITDEQYYMVDHNTAAYKFKINGLPYTIRACADPNVDMSGVFVNGRAVFEDCSLPLDYAESEYYKIYRFLIGKFQYIFGVEDNGAVDKDTFFEQFSEVYETILDASTPEEVKKLVGNYQDSTSQRASATVNIIDVDKIFIDVTWSSSATESDGWSITAKVDDGIASYDEIQHIRSSEVDGEEKIDELNDYEAGYFEIQEGKLLWTGSGNPQTYECVFEKID